MLRFYAYILGAVIVGVMALTTPVLAQTAKMTGSVGIDLISVDNMLNFSAIPVTSEQADQEEMIAFQMDIPNTNTQLVYSDELNDQGEREAVLVTLMY